MSAQRAYKMPSESESSLMSRVEEPPTKRRVDTSQSLAPQLKIQQQQTEKSNSSSFWGFDDYLVFYVKHDQLPTPRRITRRIIATPKNRGPKRYKTDMFSERMNPKNQRIGTQIETQNENVMDSQVSLFDDEEESQIISSAANQFYQSDNQRMFMTASPMKQQQ